MYRDDEPASFKRMLTTPRAHATTRSTEASRKLVELLDDLGRGYRDILKRAGPLPPLPGGLSGAGEGPPSRRGRSLRTGSTARHFHWDADKAQRLADFDPPEMLLFSFVRRHLSRLGPERRASQGRRTRTRTAAVRIAPGAGSRVEA
jgi:hypothetical protein